MKASPPSPPDALLLITSSCPHCPSVLAGLAELVKQGAIGRLEVINLTIHPEAAQTHGIRSVPWLRLGPFELEGLRSPAELRLWAERAGTRAGMAEYFRELLSEGELTRVAGMIRKDESLLAALPLLLTDPETELPVRVGISALCEEFQGHAMLMELVPALTELATRAEPHIRADTAHLLGLSGNPEAAPVLRKLLEDSQPEVREIAAEALERIAGGVHH